MHVHAFRTYISRRMLNRIQDQVRLMSQLTAKLHSQSLHHYALSQLHDNAAILTSLLHHRHYIRSCQTSLSMLLGLMPNCWHRYAILSTASQKKYILSRNCYFASLLRLRGNPHRTIRLDSIKPILLCNQSWVAICNNHKKKHIHFVAIKSDKISKNISA